MFTAVVPTNERVDLNERLDIKLQMSGLSVAKLYLKRKVQCIR
jgi:hypothetical protein